MGWRLCGRQSHLIVPVVGLKECLPLILLEFCLSPNPALLERYLFSVSRGQLMLPSLEVLLSGATDTANLLQEARYQDSTATTW